MPRGITRKDYTLLRDGQAAENLFGDEESGRKPRGATVWRLFGLAKQEVFVIVLATVALGVASLCTVAVPKLSGDLIDICIKFGQASYSEDVAKHKLNGMLYKILIVLAVGGVASGIRSWLFNSAAERVMCTLRHRLFSHLMRQEIGFYDRIRTGELMNRLSEDTRLMKSAGTSSISVALRSVVVAMFGLVLMFITSVLLTALTLAILPVLLLSFRWYAIVNKKYTAEQLTASAEASTVAEECFGSIRTVRSFAKETAACAKYEGSVKSVLKWGLKSASASGLFFGTNFAFATGGIICVLWFGARLVVENKLSPGELSTFVIYAVYVGSNVGQLAGIVSSLVQAVGASTRVFALLDRQPQMVPSGHAKPQGSPQGAQIEFRDVSFSYPSRPDIQVLKGISFEVQPGCKVALVGSSGGGKTTIVNLIERFYDPHRGSVLFDGLPLTDINHDYLHQQVSIVSQEPILFAESIMHNIAYGMPGGSASVSLAQVEEAAKIANAHDFIRSFPQGYRTQVGERGVRLSGGQKQRVAIARAILPKPRVLLLDEATSALDAESEAAVQDALDKAAQGRTVLVIAHRLSTVQNADEVIVLDHGKVVERGTHDDLIAKGGAYSVLVRRQLSAGASHAESLASLDNHQDNHSDGNSLQPPSQQTQQASSPRHPSSPRVPSNGHGRHFRERSVSPQGVRPPSPRPPRGRQVKPTRSADMTRQDTSAIVDAVMADVIGGGLEPGRNQQQDNDSSTAGSNGASQNQQQDDSAKPDGNDEKA